MTKLALTYSPDPLLRKRSEEVLEINDEIKSFINDMHETQKVKGGVGLAAVQVGHLRRIMTINHQIPAPLWDKNVQYDKCLNDENEGISSEEFPDIDSNEEFFTYTNGPIAIINPEIISTSKAKCIYDEGCLSFPDILVKDIERVQKVQIKYTDINTNLRYLAMDGFLARIFLHEYDHLEGKTIKDHASPLEKMNIEDKMQKWHKKDK